MKVQPEIKKLNTSDWLVSVDGLSAFVLNASSHSQAVEAAAAQARSIAADARWYGAEVEVLEVIERSTEMCRCGHRQIQHVEMEDECQSETSNFGEYTTKYECGCERFREPDSDD